MTKYTFGYLCKTDDQDAKARGAIGDFIQSAKEFDTLEEAINAMADYAKICAENEHFPLFKILRVKG